MKILGTILLALGVAIAAAAGIQLGSGEYRATVAQGRTVLTTSAQPEPSAPPASAPVRLEQWYRQAGGQFGAGLVLLIIGAVLGRMGISRDGAADITADGHDFGASLEHLVSEIEATRQSLDSATAQTSQTRIERLSQEQVVPMIDARYALQRRFGLAGCASVLGPLSGGERLLNRAWSTLVDGHMPETAVSLVGAAAEFQAAFDALRNLEHEQAMRGSD